VNVGNQDYLLLKKARQMTACNDMSEEDLVTIKSIVNLAKNEQIQTIEHLKNRAVAIGCNKDSVDRAINFWSEAVKKQRIVGENPEGRSQ